MNPPPLKLTAPPENTPDECDVSLGNYLRAWDQIEHQLLPLFNKMLGTHQNATQILLQVKLNQPTLRDILEALSPLRLTPKDQAALKALLRRWQSASSRRNRIVHGHWTLSVEMVKGPSGKDDHTKSKWVRFYSPADPTILSRIMRKKPDQKLQAAHRFRLRDIHQAAEDVKKLASDMAAFNNRIRVLPFVTPQPIDIDQSAIETRPEDDGG